jgi:hypothetical protein
LVGVGVIVVGVVVVVGVVGVDFGVGGRGRRAGRVAWRRAQVVLGRRLGGLGGLFPLGFFGVGVYVEPAGRGRGWLV